MAEEQVVITHCFNCKGLLKEPVTVELPEIHSMAEEWRLCDECASATLETITGELRIYYECS